MYSRVRKEKGTETLVNQVADQSTTADEKTIYDLIAYLEAGKLFFTNVEGFKANLSPKERKRLISAGVRNNGFIDKAFDIAIDNPEFIPNPFTAESLSKSIVRYDNLRQLLLVAQQFCRLVSNAFLQQSDNSYHEALQIYSNLGVQRKGKVTEAEPLHEALKGFFRKQRRFGSEFDMGIDQITTETSDGDMIKAA